MAPTLSDVSVNSCKHPEGPDGRPVCHYESPEPGREWPLAVWSCWWMAVQVNKPPLGVGSEVDDELEVELKVLSDVGSETELPHEHEAEPQPADTSYPIDEPEPEVQPESPPQSEAEADEAEHGTVERFKSGCMCRECRYAMIDQLGKWRKQLAKK